MSGSLWKESLTICICLSQMSSFNLSSCEKKNLTTCSFLLGKEVMDFDPELFELKKIIVM